MIRQLTIVATLGLALSACSQARRGVANQGAAEELWSAQNLCQNLKGAKYSGCFQITLDVTANIAFMEVTSLPWANGSFIPYRVLARPHGYSNFSVLLNNINVDVGGMVQVPAEATHNISDYEEWRVETTMVLSPTNGIDLLPAALGRGEPLAQAIIIWPELSKLNNTTLANNNK